MNKRKRELVDEDEPGANPLALPTIGRRRLPEKSLDRSQQRADVSSLFRVTRNEFSDRVRFRDESGFLYAVPRKNDELYRNYVSNNMVDGQRNITQEEASDEAPLSSKSMLLYLKMPRTRLLQRLPHGTLSLTDLKTQRNFVCVVKLVFVRSRERQGHIIVSGLTRLER